MCVAIFKNSLRAGKFNDELNEHPPRSFEEPKSKADTFIRVEVGDLAKKIRDGEIPSSSREFKGNATANDPPPKSRKDSSRQYRQKNANRSAPYVANQGAGK